MKEKLPCEIKKINQLRDFDIISEEDFRPIRKILFEKDYEIDNIIAKCEKIKINYI